MISLKIFLIALVATFTLQSIPLSCMHILDSHIQFNLNDLQEKNNYDIDIPAVYRPLLPDPTKEYKLAFNFCTKA